MTKLDDAMGRVTQDSETQLEYYNLFLDSLFYIPVIEDELDQMMENGAVPLLVEANDKTYLMLFDTMKRLTDWSNRDVKHLAATGRSITEMSSPDIYWALNYGTGQQKFFDPDEIRWLKKFITSNYDTGQHQTDDSDDR